MPVTEKERNRVNKYIHENYKWVNVLFKTQSKDDMELIEWLDKMYPSAQRRSKKVNPGVVTRVEYIKQLIREDMNRRK